MMLLPLILLLATSQPSPSVAAKPDSKSQVADLGGDWPSQPSGKRVTVEAKTPNEALKKIAAAAGWGLALNSGAAGDVNVQFSFNDVPVEEAFSAVLYASQLHATRIGDSVAVTPKGDIDDEVSESETQQNGGPGGAVTSHTKEHRRRWRHGSDNDRVQVGHDVDVPAGATVGDVVAVGGSVHLGAGVTASNVVAVGGHIDTDANVKVLNDAVAIGGGAHLGKDTTVAGQFVTLGGHLDLEPGAVVQGQQVNLGIGSLLNFDHPGMLAGGLFILFWVRKLAEFVLFFCLGALLLIAAPRQLAAIESYLTRQPLRAGLAGFLTTLAVPVLTLLLIVTLVGIPLVAVEIFGIALAALMGFTAISVLVGNRLRVPVRGGGLLGLAVGTAVVVALTALPWIGLVIWMTGWFVALGAALVTRFGSAQQV